MNDILKRIANVEVSYSEDNKYEYMYNDKFCIRLSDPHHNFCAYGLGYCDKVMELDDIFKSVTDKELPEVEGELLYPEFISYWYEKGQKDYLVGMDRYDINILFLIMNCLDSYSLFQSIRWYKFKDCLYAEDGFDNCAIIYKNKNKDVRKKRK